MTSKKSDNETVLAPNVAIIIPFKDQHELTTSCVKSIFTSTETSRLKIYLVDNNSEHQETRDAINQLSLSYPQQIVYLSYSEPFNFSAINNYAARHSKEDYIFFVNNDIEVITPGLIEAGVSTLDDEEIGAVGFELLYADGLIQHSGIRLNVRNNPYHELLHNKPTNALLENQLHETLACTGAFLGIKRNNFHAIGGFDESFPTSYNDIDLCLKLRAKDLKVVIDRTKKAFHYESKTRQLDYEFGKNNHEKRDRLAKDRANLHKKHPLIFRPCLVNIGATSSMQPSKSNWPKNQIKLPTAPYKIFFVSTTRQSNIGLDPSVIYRCINPAKKIYEMCRYSRCSVISLAKLINEFKSDSKNHSTQKNSLIHEFISSDTVVFHRPSFSIDLAQIIDKLKDNGCKVIADYDDYVFDISDYLNTSAGQRITKSSEDRQLLDGISRNFYALELFDEFIVSTEPLKLNLINTLKTASRENYKIHVIQNTPSSYWFSYAQTLFDQAHKNNKRNIDTSMIGYFGGTASHSKDFQLVHQWIQDFLEKDKDSNFIYCSVAFDQLFPSFLKEQVFGFAPVTYNKLPAIYNLSWLNIAPLSPGPFNQSKSGLKYFESAMFGLPVCATYISDIQVRFKGLPFLYTLDTLESIESSLESAQSLFSNFSEYLEAWKFTLNSLQVENNSINQTLLKVLKA